jgi:cysteinyl-tRNA synthetase
VRDYLSTLGLNIPEVILDAEGKALYAEYNQAKANKDFESSDRLRAKLIEKGIF